MSSIIIDDFANAIGGYGATVDTAAQLGSGTPVIPHCTVVAESTVTAGDAQLQSGVASASGITWTAVGSPVALTGGQGVLLTAPGAAVAFIRAVITTPVVGGKCTAVITL